MPVNPPRILAVLPGLVPSTVMGVVKPLVSLHQSGRIRAEITLEWLVRPRDVERCDLVVFCRNTLPERSAAFQTAVRCGIPFLYDIDDNFFELAGRQGGDQFRTPDGLATFTRYLTLASLVRVYSRPMLERVTSLNPNVQRVSAPVDLRLVSAPARRRDSRIKIVYATSRPDDQLCQIFLPALRRVLTEYAGRAEVCFWGCRPAGLTALRGLAGVRYRPIIRDYDRFLRRFSQGGFDIGLAPLYNDVLHRSKTNNKFREYAACRIAGIYSNVDVYSDCVRDGETGLLVENNEDAWYEALVRLVENNTLRSEIQARGRAYVEEHCRQEDFDEVWWEQIRRVLGQKKVSGTVCAQHPPGRRVPAQRVGKQCLTPFSAPASATAAAIAPAEGQEPVKRPIARNLLRTLMEYLRRHGLWRTWKTILDRLDSYRRIVALRYRLRSKG